MDREKLLNFIIDSGMTQGFYGQLVGRLLQNDSWGKLLKLMEEDGITNESELGAWLREKNYFRNSVEI